MLRARSSPPPFSMRVITISALVARLRPAARWNARNGRPAPATLPPDFGLETIVDDVLADQRIADAARVAHLRVADLRADLSVAAAVAAIQDELAAVPSQDVGDARRTALERARAAMTPHVRQQILRAIEHRSSDAYATQLSISDCGGLDGLDPVLHSEAADNVRQSCARMEGGGSVGIVGLSFRTRSAWISGSGSTLGN